MLTLNSDAEICGAAKIMGEILTGVSQLEVDQEGYPAALAKSFFRRSDELQAINRAATVQFVAKAASDAS